MRRLVVLLAVLGLAGLTLIACSSGSSTPAVSHADALACRTVYRIQQLNNISPLAVSDGQAADALVESAKGTTRALQSSLAATAEEMQLTGNDTTLLKPLVSECAAMGITAKNAENVS
jgi:hypothetical protein